MMIQLMPTLLATFQLTEDEDEVLSELDSADVVEIVE